jgi:uncharacterized protein (TIGR03118 family)
MARGVLAEARAGAGAVAVTAVVVSARAIDWSLLVTLELRWIRALRAPHKKTSIGIRGGTTRRVISFAELDNIEGVLHVNTKPNSFNRFNRAGALGLVGISSLVAAFYGCSSSSNPSTPPVNTDGGFDGTVPTATSTTDGAPPSVDAGDAGAASDAGDAGHDAGLTLQKVVETKLFVDTADAGAGDAAVDPQLKNPWGLAFNPTGPAWISNNHSGVASVYKVGADAPILVVTVPTADGGTPPSSPTGQIFNASTDFKGDKFIIATEDGTIAGWQPETDGGLPMTATRRVDNSVAGSIYKGVAIVPSTPAILVAADFHNGKLDAFNADYTPVTVDAGANTWVDSTVPTGYGPFNVATIGDKVYVAYAKQDTNKQDDTPGAGFGAVSVFDTTGKLVKSLIATGGALDAPWGMTAVGTGGWGSFPAGTLLIGNFGDGAIHAYDPATGALLGSLANSTGVPLLISGLWALQFGPTTNDAGVSTSQLYFTAGTNDEMNGLFGYLTIAP